MNTSRKRAQWRRPAAALLALLIVLAPAVGVSAQTDDDAPTESGSSPSREDRSVARAGREESRVELRAWLSSRKQMHQERSAAVREAREIMRTALAGATYPEQARAAKQAFREALRSAKAIHAAALAELGPRPVSSRDQRGTNASRGTSARVSTSTPGERGGNTD
jgi:hypothetical protein